MIEAMEAPKSVPLIDVEWLSIDWACDKYLSETDRDNWQTHTYSKRGHV